MLDRRLLLVSGKGGVGKSAITASLAIAAARAGKRVLAMGMVDGLGLALHLGVDTLGHDPREVLPGVSASVVDRARALDEYLKLQLRVPRGAPTRQFSKALNVLVDTAPGVREVISMGKPFFETQQHQWDLVVVDAPPLGQLLSYLRAPATIERLVPTGIVQSQARAIRRFLADPRRTGLVLVTIPEELPIVETVESLGELAAEPLVDLAVVAANRVLPELPVPGRVVSKLPDGPMRAAAELHRDTARASGSLARRPRRCRPPPQPVRAGDPGRGRRPAQWPVGSDTVTRTGILVVAGAGGVGKTTVSAAGAVVSAASGVDTLVVTVDPARRLGDALGVGGLGNQPSPVPGHDHLWAAMLDVAASWEGIVTRHAEPEVADRLVANPYFRAIADRFPAAQAYAAGEQMAEFADGGTWERVIVDTPPAAGGIDFMLAPRAMQDLLGSRLLNWLTGAGIPGRRALYRVTARPMLRMADTVLGGPLLEEIAEFLLDLRTVYDGLSARAIEVERHLQSARTVLVTTSAPSPLREVRRFLDDLPTALAPAAVIFNRVLPEEWAQTDEPVEPEGVKQAHRVALHDNLDRWGAEARREADSRRQFAAAYPVPVATIPLLTSPPTDLKGLDALAEAAPEMVEALFG